MKMHQLCVALLAGIALAGSACAQQFAPGLFAFQNGCRFENLDQEVATLKELGYVGIGSAKLDRLEERIAAYHKADMKVCSIYVGVHLDQNGGRMDEGIPEAIKRLRGTGALIELTIQGKADNAGEQVVRLVRQVADLAAEAGLKVALYPHHGFYVARISEALAVIEKVDRKNVGLTFNLCHYLMGENIADLEKTIAGVKPHLYQVTTCGADNDGKNWKQLIQTLDKGSFDQRRLIKAMALAGFEGRVGLQCYQVEGSSAEILARSMEAWSGLLTRHANP